MTTVTVVGSVNLDLVATAARLPLPGETISDAVLARHPGGKGANQALAAARMGAEVRLVASVGSDPDATLATELLDRAGVDRSGGRVSDLPTGVALIVVDFAGENQIVVAPGANRDLRATDVEVGDADVVVTQLEVPVDAVAAAVRSGSYSIVNCAPARDLPDGVLGGADAVILNETEARFYGSRLDAVSLVVVTLGSKGAVAYSRGSEIARVAAPRVRVIDTVGAGDTFVGAFAVAMGEGDSLERALAVSVTAGSLATTIRGAQPSIPTRDAVRREMGET